MLKDQKVDDLLNQRLDDFVFREELKMFCRDCQNALRVVKTAHENVFRLLKEAKQEAKSWEKVYTDLTLIVEEHKVLLETLKRENEWNVEIIEEWEKRRLEEVST